MTFLSLIRFSARKVQSIPCFPNAPKNMAATLPLQISLRPLSSCTTRCLSVNHCLQMLLARTTTCPDPRSTALGHRTQPRIHSSIHRSQHALFNTTGHQKNFARGGAAPNTQHIYISLKPTGLPPTSTLQHPKGHCQSHFAEVFHKPAALDFGPGSISTRSRSLTSSTQTALFYTARLRTPLSSSRDAVDLRAFGLKDVLQPPGAR